jgi:hypothetical protein
MPDTTTFNTSGSDSLSDVYMDCDGNEYDPETRESFSTDPQYSGDESDYCEEEFADMTLEERKNTPCPFKAALMKNIDEARNAQDSERQSRRDGQCGVKPVQRVFCSKPIFQIQEIKKSAQRVLTNRIGDAEVFMEDEDVGTLTEASIDCKGTINLVRLRGNRLTSKQAEVKAKRIKAKPTSSS